MTVENGVADPVVEDQNLEGEIPEGEDPTADDKVGGDIDEEDKPKDGETKENHQSRRWKRLIHERGVAMGEVKALKEQLAAVKKNPETVEPEPVPEDTTPQRDSFSTDEEYVQALVDYRVNIALSNKDGQTQAQQREQAVTAKFKVLEDEFKALTPDYDEVIKNADSVEIPKIAIQALRLNPAAPAIRYHLCAHPEQAAAINEMSDIEAVAEIGRLGAILKMPQKKKPVSSAPEPIEPVGGGSGNAKVKRDDLPYKEWEALRKKELTKK